MIGAGQQELPEAEGTVLVPPGGKGSGVPNSSPPTPARGLLQRQSQALCQGVWQDSWRLLRSN